MDQRKNEHSRKIVQKNRKSRKEMGDVAENKEDGQRLGLQPCNIGYGYRVEQFVRV